MTVTCGLLFSSDVGRADSGWSLLPRSMSIYHDNGRGRPEQKFVNMNGREAVFDGDSGKLLTNGWRGSYNYVTPTSTSSVRIARMCRACVAHADTNRQVRNLDSAVEFGLRGVGHVVADVLPSK